MTPRFALFSGGHDSLAATVIASRAPNFAGVVHINTGIGIEETREFVRETCRRERWPLIELHAEKTYEELVLTRGGFPRGPRAHNSMYYWLKQRQVRRLVRSQKDGWLGRVELSTGIRVDESVRRMGANLAVPERREGAIVWLNPILYWTALKVSTFIDDERLDRNRVVDLLHRSGECLCGALAHRDEIREIELWFPAVAQRIHDLEARARELNLPSQRWATERSRTDREQMKALALCSSCQLNYLEDK